MLFEEKGKKLISFLLLPQMGLDIINLQHAHFGLCWEGARGVDGAGAGGAEWAPATAAGAGCSLIPSWAWLCSWALLGRAGHTLWCPGHTFFISATVHRQELSTGSLLLVPLKPCYRNQNPQQAAKLFPFGCAPDQTNSKNWSCVLSKHQ